MFGGVDFGRWEELKVAKQLIEEYHLSPSFQDNKGLTPMHWSCTHEM